MPPLLVFAGEGAMIGRATTVPRGTKNAASCISVWKAPDGHPVIGRVTNGFEVRSAIPFQLTALPFHLPERVVVPDVTPAFMFETRSVRRDDLELSVNSTLRLSSSPTRSMMRYGASLFLAYSARFLKELSLSSCA
jgi:hypothetical protein